MADRTQLTPERLAELRRIAEAATPGPWEVTEFAGGEERSPGELGVFAPNHPHSYQKSDGTWYAVVICRGMDGPTREENSEYIATFDPTTVLAMLDEIERLRQAVDALQLDRRDLEDVISVLEQEQRRAGRYLEDARDELAHGRIQSAEHRIIDALVSLSSKERRTDTRLKTAVESGGGE